ncbi:hypothetical protein FRC17_000445 [Serendipita sp. 399]|nr:hypothetical protein FRC17_000445 [Serendipita sp. 399]
MRYNRSIKTIQIGGICRTYHTCVTNSRLRVTVNRTKGTEPQYRFYKPGATRPSPIFNIRSDDARYAFSPESPLVDEPALDGWGLGTHRQERLEDNAYLGGQLGAISEQIPEWRRDARGPDSPPIWSNPPSGHGKKKKKSKQRKQDNYNASQTVKSADEYYESQAMNDPFEALLPTADRILEPTKGPEVPEELDLWAADKKKKQIVYS